MEMSHVAMSYNYRTFDSLDEKDMEKNNQLGFWRDRKRVWDFSHHDREGDVCCGGAWQALHGDVPQPVLRDVQGPVPPGGES